jgi:hypothetical protein
MATLTAANSALSITIGSLYAVPLTLQGYAVDDAFATQDVQTGETVIGVDGLMSYGYTPYTTPLDIYLQADSVSMPIFDNLIGVEKANREKQIIAVSIVLPSIQMTFDFATGILKMASPMPSVKKVLQFRKFSFEFQDMFAAPI